MQRFMIYARHRNTKDKFIPLFKKHRHYKTETYGKKMLQVQRAFCPELELELRKVKIHSCPLCGTAQE